MVSPLLGLQDLARDARQQVALEQEQQPLAARRLGARFRALDGQLLWQLFVQLVQLRQHHAPHVGDGRAERVLDLQ